MKHFMAISVFIMTLNIAASDHRVELWNDIPNGHRVVVEYSCDLEKYTILSSGSHVKCANNGRLRIGSRVGRIGPNACGPGYYYKLMTKWSNSHSFSWVFRGACIHHDAIDTDIDDVRDLEGHDHE